MGLLYPLNRFAEIFDHPLSAGWCRLATSLALFGILLLLGSPAEMRAQTLTLLDVDTDRFPDLEGSVLLTDANGEPVTPFRAEELSLMEMGFPRTITSISCPTPGDPVPMSVVLVIDRSGSMTAPLPNGELPIDMVADGVDAFLETFLFTPPTAVAMTAFNEDVVLLSDFRTASQPLRSALDGLTAEGGTLYDPPLLDPLDGAMSLLRTRSDTVRRVVIFITDGEPEARPSVTGIVGEARAANTEIYAVTIGSRMTPELALIAERSGGKGWGSVQTSEQLAGLLRSVALISRGISPCIIRWRTDLACGPGPLWRDAMLVHEPTSTVANNVYRVPSQKLVTLAPSKRLLYFGATRFPDVAEQTLRITARNGTFQVLGTEFSDADHFELVNWGGAAPPFTLEDGESRDIRIRFTPKDTAAYGSDFRILGLPCDSRNVLLAGGDRNPDTTISPLTLRSPVGGESFNACDSVSITWTGVEPETPVRVQYSRADGRGWQTISDSATGFEFRWMPPAPDTTYRIRISTNAAEQHLISTIAGGGAIDEDSIFAVDAALAFPMGIDATGGYVVVAENGKHRIRKIDLQSGIISSYAGTGFTGNGGDGAPGPLARLNSPTDIFIERDTSFLTEYPRVRAIDTGTGIIVTYAGNTTREWAPDGTHMVGTGSLMVPFSVVADSQYIYISELDSHRIRRIDRTTRIITTIAGGGGTGGFDSDGRPATEAYLLLPKGLALRDSMLYVAEEVGHRVRSVNLNTGIIRTVAGNGAIGDDGDGGPARSARLDGPIDIELWGDSLLIADRYANRIRIVDLKTGVIDAFAGVSSIGGFSGDGGPARNARFNSPAGLVRQGDLLFVSDRLNNRVRQITLYRAEGIDSSGSIFSVAAPSVRFASPIVTFGPTVEGGRRDSVITALYCNDGDVAMTLDSTEIFGDHPGDFVITGGTSPEAIAPGECRTITIAFKPNATGPRAAIALFYGSCTNPDTLQLRGVGRPDCGLESLELVELEPVVLEGTPGMRDTVVTSTLCNNGSGPVSGKLLLDSPDGAWSLVTSADFALATGECLDVTLRFNPAYAGRSMAAITYRLDQECRAALTLLSGRALRPPALAVNGIAFDTLLCPDDVLDTTVTLRNEGEVPLEVSGISLLENDEGFSLRGQIPTPGAPLVILPGASAELTLRLAPTSAGAKSVRLSIASNDPDGEIEVILTGQRDSSRVVSTTSTVVVLRDDAGGYPRDTVVRYLNTGDRPVTIDRLDIGGGDPSFYSVDPSLFPLTLGPGDTIAIPLSLLEPTEDRSYRATFTPVITTPCILPVPSTTVVHSGSRPQLRDERFPFGVIPCDEPSMVDTTIRLYNDGGIPLEISELRIIDDNDGVFELLTTAPLTIPPGGSIEVALRYRPAGPGLSTASLQLTTNTENGLEEIEISGEKGSATFDVDRASIVFDPAAPAPNQESITLTNGGTLPIVWNADDIIGPFEVVSITPPGAGPGESSVVVIRYTPGVPGTGSGRVTILENNCGFERQVTLEADDPSGLLQLLLPVDSGLVNTDVTLPVRYAVTGGALPLPTDSFYVSISFFGTTFLYDDVRNAEEIDRRWDRESHTMEIDLRGRFGDADGDILFELIGAAGNGREAITPLLFDQVRWSRPAISTDTANGSFTVLGLCLDDALHLEVRGPVVKAITPQPARGHVTARIELPVWTSLQGTLIDGNGRKRVVYEAEYLEAGTYDLELDVDALPAGAYLLLFESPHGTGSSMLIIR